MKKKQKMLIFGMIVVFLVISACQAQATALPIEVEQTQSIEVEEAPTLSPEVPSSPCDEVMSEKEFGTQYEGQTVTYLGAYSDGLVFAYGVDGHVLCATTVNDNVVFPQFVQEVIEEDGVAWSEGTPYFDERFNGLIGQSGILEVERYASGEVQDLTIHNLEPIQLFGRPASCIDLDQESVLKLNDKEITIVGKTDDENGWDNVYFESDGTTYCYENTYLEALINVTDITGKTVQVEIYSGNRYDLMNLKGILRFNEANMIYGSPVVGGPSEQMIMFLLVGESREINFGDPMVFEFKSRPGYVDIVSWNTTHGEYKLVVDSTIPETVAPGYVYSPEKYIDGGELIVGTVLGEIEGVPMKVDSIECAFGGMSLLPVQSVNFVTNEGYDYTIPIPDTYLYLLKGTGNGQVITYYHVPALAEGCPTEYNVDN